MAALRMILQYVGTRTQGWQSQPHRRTIQDLLEEAFSRILRQSVRVIGAGRTDSGVHAVAQTALIRLNGRKIPPLERLQYSVNSLLSPDIAVLQLEKVPATFHPIREAHEKNYRYYLWNHSVRPVFDRERLWHLPQVLDLQRMRRAGRLITGRRDFSSFAAAGGKTKTAVRTLRSLRIRREQSPWWPLRGKSPLIVLEFEGEGFLRQMVRNIVGTLVEIGLGRKGVREIPSILEARDRRAAGRTAPAGGLHLMEVSYPRFRATEHIS